MAEVGKVTVRVSPDTSRFRRELKAQLEEIENRLRVNIDVDPDMKGFRQRVKAETRGLKADIQLDVDRSVFSRLREQLSKIEAPSFGSGVNGAGFAAIFAGVAAVAAPAMALLTSSLLAVPGLLAAVAAPIGAITLGLDGIKAAASRLTAPFQSLKDTMNAVNETAFTPVFDKLGAIFPTLAKSLPKVSQGLADVAQSIVDTVTSSGGMAKIESTITNIGKAISKSAPGFGAFTDGILTLVQSFSEKLPNLADWVNGAGKSFSDWITKITQDGTLSKAFDGLGGTLKTIAEALGSMASEGLKFMQDPKNIQDFNAGLKSIGDTLTSIVTLSNQLNSMGDLFTNLLPSFDFEKIKQDLTAPFTSADAPWRGMADSIKAAFADVYASVSGVVGQVISTFNRVPAALQSAWGQLSGIAAGAFSAIASAISSAMANCVAAVVSGAGQVVAEIQALPGKITAAAGNFAGALVSAGKALMDGLLSGIRSGLQSVLDFASGIAAKIAAVKGPLSYDKTVLTPNGEALMQGLGDGIENGMSEVLKKAKGIAGKISDEISPDGNIGADWSSQFQSIIQAPTDFARANVDQFAADLGIGGGALTAAADQGIGWVTQALSQLASGAFGGGTNIQVLSVDDAIAAQQTLQNKKALQYTGR